MPHGGGGGQHGGGGIEGLTPPTGLLTAMGALVGFGAAIWVFTKHPRIFGRIFVVSLFGSQLFYTNGDLMTHPLITLFMVFVGVCCAGKHN